MQWINIKEELPEKGGYYLTFYRKPTVKSFVACYADTFSIALFDVKQQRFYTHGSWGIDVDYWCELVAPVINDEFNI